MQEDCQTSSPRSLQLKSQDKSLAEIDLSNIWKDDALNRDRDASNLEALIAGQEGPLTLCLDGAWGTGKTFFLRRFKSQWEASGGKALYFNAWEDDNLDDPLIALIGQLWSLLKPSGMDGLVDNIKKCTIPLLKKIALNRVGVDGKDVSSSASNAFDEYADLQASRQQLKECLTEIADTIFNSSHRPLLFIVDELDRCRPSFSVALLERIKHLFPIRHIVFLVGVDREQVTASVRAVYGDIDAENYLHRFFDATLKLRQFSPSQFIYATYGNLSSQDRSPTVNHILSTRFEFARKFCPLIQHFNLSLREVEVAMRTYMLMPSASFEAGDVMMRGLLIALRMRDKVAYSHLVNWDLPIGKLIDVIFGNLLEYDELSNDTSPISFVRYLYRLEIMYDDNSQQNRDLLALIKRMENGEDYDMNSPLIAECFRNNREPHIQDFLMQTKEFVGSRYYDFRGAFHAIDEHLQQIGDIRLS